MADFEEISGYVRPEWVNKWPNSMTDIWWWWWWTRGPSNFDITSTGRTQYRSQDFGH